MALDDEEGTRALEALLTGTSAVDDDVPRSQGLGGIFAADIVLVVFTAHAMIRGVAAHKNLMCQQT